MIVRLFCCLFGFGPDAITRTRSGIRSECLCVGEPGGKRLEPCGDAVNNPACDRPMGHQVSREAFRGDPEKTGSGQPSAAQRGG